MGEKTFISIEFWQLVGFLLGFLGVCFTFGKALLSQFQTQLLERNRQQDKMMEKLDSIEKKQADLDATLPLNYVLREDYIRFNAKLEAKMDSIHGKVDEIYKMERTRQ